MPTLDNLQLAGVTGTDKKGKTVVNSWNYCSCAYSWVSWGIASCACLLPTDAMIDKLADQYFIGLSTKTRWQ